MMQLSFSALLLLATPANVGARKLSMQLARTTLLDFEHALEHVFDRWNTTSHAVFASPRTTVSRAIPPAKNPIGRRVTNTTPISDEPPVLARECGVSFQEHPKAVTCPQGCPFIRNEPAGICDFSCVTADQCGKVNPLTSFANPETMRCGVCNVVACKACVNSSNTCGECQDGFEYVHGQCLMTRRWFQYAVYVGMVPLVVLVVGYFVTLANRPVVNEDVTEAGLKFRNLAKTRNEETGNMYSLWSTNLCNEYVSGLGIMLHFRWQRAMLVYAVVVTVVLYTFGSGPDSSEPEIMQQNVKQEDTFDACNAHVTEQVDETRLREVSLFWVVFLIYICSTASAVAFAVYQKRFANRESDDQITMQDYVIAVTGLPEMTGTEPVEEDLQKFFQQAFSACGEVEVIGVSPCWNYRKEVDAVQDRARWEIENVEARAEAAGFASTRVNRFRPQRGSFKATVSSLVVAPTTPSPRGPIPTVDSGDVPKRTWRETMDSFFHEFDVIFGFRSEEEDLRAVKAHERSAREVRVMLESMYTSDVAFVVVGTEGQRDRVLEYFENKRIKLRGCQLTLKKESGEPTSVLWHNAGMGHDEFIGRFIFGVLALISTVLLLDILFYFPSVSYLMTMSSIIGMTQGGTWGMMMGGLVVISNQIIYQIIGQIADRLGFTRIDNHQRFYVIFYTAAVFFNTIIDLFVVLLLAQGFSMEQAVEMQASRDSSMNTQAIANNPSMQRAIHVQFVAYLVPSCIILPFMMEPLANAGLFLLMKFLVRSRSSVTCEKAEGVLACPQFDLSRYGDIAINIMLCAGTLAFSSTDVYYLFMWLVISLIWLYGWDSYRFLRLSTRSSFVTVHMDETAHILCTGPCAVIAACLGFRVYSMQNYITESVESAMDRLGGSATIGVMGILSNGRDTICLVMVLFGMAHLCGHLAVLRYWVPKWGEAKQVHDTNVPYAETSHKLTCNWFNANPVYCLRSKYYYEHQTPCLQFQVGKEHFLHVNQGKDNGRYWESVTWVSDLGGSDEVDDIGEAKRKLATNWEAAKGTVASLKTRIPTEWPDIQSVRALLTKESAPQDDEETGKSKEDEKTGKDKDQARPSSSPPEADDPWSREF